MMTLVLQLKKRVFRFPLASDIREVTAGSLPENSIHLPYRGISRHHFALRKKGSDWILYDLGSTNGTSLNGEKITEAKVRVGDCIQAGIAKLFVEKSHGTTPVSISMQPTLQQPAPNRMSSLPFSQVKTKLSGRRPLEGIDEEIERKLREGTARLKSSVQDFTRKMIVHALALNGGNVRRAAEQLDVTVFGLRKMMKRLNIDS